MSTKSKRAAKRTARDRWAIHIVTDNGVLTEISGPRSEKVKQAFNTIWLAADRFKIRKGVTYQGTI